MQKLKVEQEEELQRLEKELEALEKQSAFVDQQIVQVTTNVETSTHFIEQRQQQTIALEKARGRRKELYAEYVDKEQTIASTKEILDDTRRAHHKAKEEAAKLAKLKAENDAAESEALIADMELDKATLASLEELLENLTNGKSGENCEEDVVSAKKNLLKETMVQLEAMDQELASEAKTRDAKAMELEHHQNKLNEHHASHQAAYQAIADDVSAHIDTEQALQKRLDENQRVLTEALEWGRTLKIFRSGKELHKKMDVKEREARNAAGVQK